MKIWKLEQRRHGFLLDAELFEFPFLSSFPSNMNFGVSLGIGNNNNSDNNNDHKDNDNLIFFVTRCK